VPRDKLARHFFLTLEPVSSEAPTNPEAHSFDRTVEPFFEKVI